MKSLDKNHNLCCPRLCACCGKEVVGLFDICGICGWQNDSLQNNNPDYKRGANEMSLNEAKEAYAKGKEII